MSDKMRAYRKNAVSKKEYLNGYDKIDWTKNETKGKEKNETEIRRRKKTRQD
jgi:hypothetical protein